MPGNFFDTNILLYSVGSDEAKATRADELLEIGGTISVQVLNEITNVARRKMQLDWDELHDFLASIRSIVGILPLTVELHETGLAVAERYKLSTYDAMIVATAIHADCSTLWSEDMQHGLCIDERLHIRNPFRAD